MGQLFVACAYDIKNRNSFVYHCDKFHSDCYSVSGSVVLMHYLLRKAPYRVIWWGDYNFDKDIFKLYTSEEYLLGLSVFLDLENKPIHNDNGETINDEEFKKHEEFVKKNFCLWNRMDMHKTLEEAKEYFKFNYTHSVNYSGFLVNHSKKLAINLEDYYEKSVSMDPKGQCFSIDPIPVLTETGGGVEMALIDGISIETTEELSETWCADLLQILDTLPGEYKLINCCFANSRYRSFYCYNNYGIDNEELILKNKEKEKFEAVMLNILGERSKPVKLKVSKNENKLQFEPVI